MKTFLSAVAGIAVLSIGVSGIQCSKHADDKATIQSKYETQAKVVDVDELVSHPDEFKGSIVVTGMVTQLNESKSSFVLGCEDACVALPVRFKGKIPAVGTEVSVYGEVKKVEDGKFIFAAQEIKSE